MPFELEPVPPQPPEEAWAFVEELRVTPYHQPVSWRPRRPAADEAHFPAGLRLEARFDDPRGLLETAWADFRFFLQSAGLPDSGGNVLSVGHCATSIREEFRVRVEQGRCEVAAADTEGIRRGLVWLEDEMLRRGGPFLPLGEFTRRPVVRTRISRCFYGPVNRPPKSKDELADDVDYYPEEYLNRLAHQGVNALWFTVHFFETVPSKIIPEYGQNAGPRLEKLRRTVEKCARYGIRIYPFCIEPAAFTWPHAVVKAAAAAHPDLRGHNGAFCTSTEKGQAYLEEATRTLFSEVPGLGGLLVIPVGERFTHCYSGSIPQGGTWPSPNTCPRCSQRLPWDVLADTLSGLARGMHSVDPGTELIAWPYGQFIAWGPEATVEAARHMPPEVILQHNFETGGHNRQLGKLRPAWDYWLSYAGPSALFERSAQAAVAAGARMSAKLQVGCSHEVATTQVVPAPGILHKKYAAMRRLGVSAAMHSWYFGTYPSLMARAAGELSFDPCPEDVPDFLLSLAQRDWGEHAPAVAKAWQWFERGYSQYPTAHIFGYFGPMHDGPAWPLYLVPRRRPLAPTWQVGYPPSGDHIAECVTNGFTLDEMLTLCRRMAERWGRGVEILKGVLPHFTENPERVKEIGLAVALGLQFRSGYNILRFYSLREQLADSHLEGSMDGQTIHTPTTRLGLLAEMRVLVQEEMAVTEELLPLAEADSRLGFHSEAEGYKYFPDLLRWRVRQLERLLDEEFPAVEAMAEQPGPLFPDYTGEAPAGAAYACARVERAPRLDGKPSAGVWEDLPAAECAHWLHQVYSQERWKRCGYDPHDHLPLPDEDRHGRATTWKACHDGRYLYVGVSCLAGDPAAGGGFGGVQVTVEPRRTEPRRQFHIGPDGSVRCIHDDGYIPRAGTPWRIASHAEDGRWSFVLRIPLRWLDRGGARGTRPMRINVARTLSEPGKEGSAISSWANLQPVRGRLVWGYLNPDTDFGWLLFE